MTSLSALAIRAKEAYLGRDTFKLMPEILAHQQLDAAQIREQGWRRLRENVHFAANQVPYYQQAWLGIDLEQALECPAAFAQFPILDRPALNAAGTDMIAPDLPGQVQLGRTSGSSGDRLHFWTDRRRSGWSAAARLRARRWWGLDDGVRMVRFYPEPYIAGIAVRQRLAQAMTKVGHRLSGITQISTFAMTRDDMLRHVRVLNAAHPSLISGYGVSLERLAGFMYDEGLLLTNDHLAVVTYMSEPVSETGRQVIQQVMGAPLASEYACREFGLIAHECPHGNLHISDDNLFLEVVDKAGRPVVGEIGEIVLTDLRASRTPFIRYRLGDLGRLMPGDYRCPCGLGMRVLGQLTGRAHEYVPLGDGGGLPIFAFDRITAGLEGVSHWQVRISAPRQLRFLIETTPERLGSAQKRMLAWLVSRTNHEYDVSIEAVPHISPSASGKYARIVYEDGQAPLQSRAPASPEKADSKP